MATTQPTSFPTIQPTHAYTTPPNSQGYQPYPPPNAYPPQFPPHQYLPHQYPPQYLQMDPSSSTTPTPTPPSTISPTSPSALTSLPLANRQHRTPKSPMYIPAALRPTERQHRPSPLTPPRSVHGSTDSLEAEGHPARPLSRRSTDKTKKPLLSEVSESAPEQEEEPPIPTHDLPPVTDLPTRSHWKPDRNAVVCDAPVCQKRFGIWERRHHCRHCGNIFCNEHSSWQVPLDQDAEFHPKGAQCRGCGHCWGEYNRWIDERAQGIFGGPVLRRTESKPIENAPKPQGQRHSIAQSLTRGDWNWSTF